MDKNKLFNSMNYINQEWVEQAKPTRNKRVNLKKNKKYKTVTEETEMKKQMLALALLLCAVFAFALCTAAAYRRRGFAHL